MTNINNTQSPKLYLITNDDKFDVLYQKLTVALETKVVSRLQIRRKNVSSKKSLYREIEAICLLVDDYDCDVIINDDMQLAKDFGAGVHLGQSDGSVTYARELLGKKAIIGSTCHGSSALIEDAIKSGASYAAMGAVFSSTTKVNAKTVSFEQLKQGSNICHEAGIDFCVIGGITSQNINQLEGLAVDYVAVVNDVLGGNLKEVKRKCQLWQSALNDYKLSVNK